MAQSYVKHGPSIGTLRQKMVRRFLANETPERFRVETGFIRTDDGKVTSRECDILVHDARHATPLYRYDDLVVVRAHAARAVIEVKSDLNTERFGEFLRIHASVLSIVNQANCGAVDTPTFAYGLNGATFCTIVDSLTAAIRKNELNCDEVRRHLNWPSCIAVQTRNIFGVRAQKCASGGSLPFFIVDFSTIKDQVGGPSDGVETGCFIQAYADLLQNAGSNLAYSDLREWFNTTAQLTRGPS